MKGYAFLIACFISASIIGQSLRVYEISAMQKRTSLGKLSVVDINSNLEIKISKDTLALAVSNTNNSHPEMQHTLDMFARILRYQKGIQEILSAKIDANLSLEQRLEILGSYSTLVSTMYKEVSEDRVLNAKFIQYSDDFDELLDTEKQKWNFNYVPWALEQINIEVKRSFDSLRNNLVAEQVKIQLYAFVHTKKENYRRVHIQNFDNFKEGEFFEVARFATSFSTEDLEALKVNQHLANQLNVLVKNNYSNVSALLQESFNSYDCALKLQVTVQSMLNKTQNSVAADRYKIEADLNALNSELAKILDLFRGVKNINLNASFGFETLADIEAQLSGITESFKTKTNHIASTIAHSTDSTKQAFTALVADFEKCQALLKEDFEKIRGIYNVSAQLINPGAQAAKTGQAIANDAIEFSIDNLPDSGYINLKTTGKREDNDQVEIQLRVVRKKVSDEPIIIEKKFLTMMQVKVHSVSNISLILASPYSFSTDIVKLENKFQFAPAGNLLFKKGSRTSKTWNFVNPGIGFSMSTPDFDLDGVPEVGVGAVATLLNDVLSVGISYNTKTDNPYWFFGLSLPFNMMGLPVNTVEVEKIGQ